MYNFHLGVDISGLEKFDHILSKFKSVNDKFSEFGRKFKTAFGSAGQSVDELRKKLESLKGKRDLMIGTGQIRRANQEIGQLEARINKLQSIGTRSESKSGSGGSWLGNLARGALPIMGVAGLIAGAGSLATSGMSAEQTKLAYSQFAGEQAKPLYERLNKFANDTSFSNQQILQGGRTMLASGFDPQSIVGNLKTIGNISAGSGKDFGGLAEAVAKIKQKGFVDNGDIIQEFGGTPLMEVLQKNLGVDGGGLYKMAEKRQVRYEDLAKAMITMTTGDGVFTGYLEKDMATAKGKLSTFMGNLEYKFQQWGETQNGNLGKIFDFGTKFIEKMGPIEDAVGRLFQAFAPLGESLKGLLNLFGLVSKNGSAMDGVIRILTFTVNALTVVVSGLLSPLGQFYIAGAAIYTLLGSLPTILKAVTLAFSSNPVTVWLVALGALVVGLKYAYDNLEWFRDGVDRIGQTIKGVFENIGPILMALVLPTPANIMAAIKSIGKAWDAASSRVGQAGKESGNREAYESERDDHSLKPQKPKYGYTGKLANASSPSASADVSAVTGGTKSTSITINMKSLVEKLTIHANTAQEGVADMEGQLTDALLRILNSANSMAT